MIDYPLKLFFRIILRIFLYIICESVVMVATLQSLGINVKDYCNKFSKLLMDSDPLSNPLLAIGLMNIGMILLVSWDILDGKYDVKGE